MPIRFLKLTLIISALIALGLYAKLNNPRNPEFAGFSEFTWTNMEGWTAGTPNPEVPGSGQSISFVPRQSFNRWATAVSAPVSILGMRATLQGYGRRPPGRFAVQVETVESENPKYKNLVFKFRPEVTLGQSWSDIVLDLPKEIVGTKSTFTIFAEQPKVSGDLSKNPFLLRNKIDFERKYRGLPEGGGVPTQAMVGTGAIGLLLLLLLQCGGGGQPCSSRCLYGIYFTVTLAVFFHCSLFFHWDEWDVLFRLQNEGFATVFKPHNEHFIPLFLLIYWLESLVFSDHYFLFTALTAAIHALNTVLFIRLLQRLTPPNLMPKAGVYQAIGLLYLLNVVHVEVLQWAFEISIAGSQTMLWLCCHQALNFVTDGKWRALALTALLAGAAPLMFGNGLALPLQIAALLSLPLIGGSIAAGAGALPVNLRLKRLAAVYGATLAPCAAAYFAYKKFAPSSGSENLGQKIAGNLDSIGEYLFVGSQFGAVLRSTGLYPSMAIETSPILLKKLLAGSPGLSILIPKIPADQLFAWIGLIISLIVLLATLAVYGRSGKNRSFPFICFVSGQFFILVTLLLPALGRWQFGAFQSLSPRYHYQTLPGVMLIFFPLLLAGLHMLNTAPALKYKAPVVAMILLFYTFFHLGLSSSFNYFTDKGINSRVFVGQLASWEAVRIKEATAGRVIPPYDGSGSPHQGMFPVPVEPLSPGLHPDQAYQVLSRLNPHRYPPLQKP